VSSLQGRAAIRAVLDEIRPDVLHAHYLSRYGWQARLSGFHPYVVTPWGSDLFVTLRRSLRARLWARFSLRGADLVTVASAQMADAVVAAGARRTRVVAIQFGVDSERFSPGPADPSLGASLGLGGTIIFSPRSLRPIYRHEIILPAVAQLAGDIRLVMSGRNADPSYRRSLEQQAAALGIDGRLLILDEIRDDEMPELYRLASVVVSVPDSDGVPVSVLEAMACGTPVVASDLPGVRETLGAVAPKLLVPPGDSGSLADALRSALQLDGSEREALSMALREWVTANADQRVNMLRMEALYRDLAMPR
jgi:glycosyltransferase involved in cell wall biosynthesis